MRNVPQKNALKNAEIKKKGKFKQRKQKANSIQTHIF